VTVSDWDRSYEGEKKAPWDIGRPQPAFVRLAEQGLMAGRLLDAGCGTGEQSLLAAAHGADVTGIDVSPLAIGAARAKAADRGITVNFQVGDVLDLGKLSMTFDTVIDSGVFHVFDDADRARYVASLVSAVRPGATLYLMCFSDRLPGTIGPRRVGRDELAAAFADGWDVAEIAADTFDINAGWGFGTEQPQAWRATIRRADCGRETGDQLI
jgi:SAM-dependent methyltransferase